jgi:hypothetical protein
MYIVAIGWAYVIIMMAVASGSFVKGLGILVGLGILPLALFIYVFDAPRRRQRRARQMSDQKNANKTCAQWQQAGPSGAGQESDRT